MISNKSQIPKLLPPPSINITPPTLTPEHQKACQSLKILLEPLLVDPLEKEFCDDACLCRYLRASKWSVETALQRLQNTLKWRKEYEPHKIEPDHVSHEALTGKQFFNGFDKQGRPILYLVPGRENTKASDRQLKFVVYNLEKAIQLMPEGVETLVIILDYENMGIWNAPSPNTGRKFLSILGDHYPERLGLAFVVNPTWYLYTFFTVSWCEAPLFSLSPLFGEIIGPFMDPVTRAKVHLVSKGNKDHESASSKHQVKGVNDMTYYIEPSHLLTEYGGEHEFEWHFESYWHRLNSI